ncbi:hypothetical protein [Leptolyngbya sp. CCY15150]|uniref:hypothetical protein n=1 Tax=Leptolyngbya sp. CCY15150 TaxID=2767772 RepID=UPI0019526252|nr:hypothetical protein [Leptolyngbya sp. CCY15150]
MNPSQFSRYLSGRQRSPKAATITEWSKAWGIPEDQVERIVADPMEARRFYQEHGERLLRTCDPPPMNGVRPLLQRESVSPEAQDLIDSLTRFVESVAPKSEQSPYLTPSRCNFVAGVLTSTCGSTDTKKPPGMTEERAEEIQRGASYLIDSELDSIAQFTGLSIDRLRSACTAEGCPVFPEDPSRSQLGAIAPNSF